MVRRGDEVEEVEAAMKRWFAATAAALDMWRGGRGESSTQRACTKNKKQKGERDDDLQTILYNLKIMITLCKVIYRYMCF